MNWTRSAATGAIAALAMFVVIQVLIRTGAAPFQMAPSAAALTAWGLPALPLALLVHFGYGMAWAVLFAAVLGDRATLGAGLGLGVLLWLGMMLVASPAIGWGVFGTADTSSLPAKLQLGSTMTYVVGTLVLHLLYGAIVGALTPAWVLAGHRGRAAQHHAAG